MLAKNHIFISLAKNKCSLILGFAILVTFTTFPGPGNLPWRVWSWGAREGNESRGGFRILRGVFYRLRRVLF